MEAVPVVERPILFSDAMVRAILDGRKTQTRRVVLPTKRPGKLQIPPLHMEPWLIDGEQEHDDAGRPLWLGEHPNYPSGSRWFSCPYGAPGERLWVREAWQAEFWTPEMLLAWAHETPSRRRLGSLCNTVAYRADGRAFAFADDQYEARGDGEPGHPARRVDDLAETFPELRPWEPPPRWMPGIFLPRWVSRLTLNVEAVRVERLQAITEADALAEGCEPIPGAQTWTLGESPATARPHTARDSFAALWDEINGGRGVPWSSNPWVWVVSFRRVD